MVGGEGNFDGVVVVVVVVVVVAVVVAVAAVVVVFGFIMCMEWMVVVGFVFLCSSGCRGLWWPVGGVWLLPEVVVLSCRVSGQCVCLGDVVSSWLCCRVRT